MPMCIECATISAAASECVHEPREIDEANRKQTRCRPRIKLMPKDKYLIFHIDAYSPETIPLAKLADYMTEFAALLGRDNAVHFGGLTSGSTKLAAIVEYEDVPKVTARLGDLRRGSAAKDVMKVFEAIDTRLANDNATGRIYVEDQEGSAELLTFPGRTKPKALTYGPFNQEGHLDGILISVGGKDESISIRLQNGDVTHANCETNRTIARDMGKHLFELIRIHGTGRWTREADGAWTLLRFRIHRFEVLKQDSLREVVSILRAVRGNGWKEIKEPLAELADLRGDEDEMH